MNRNLYYFIFLILKNENKVIMFLLFAPEKNEINETLQTEAKIKITKQQNLLKF